MNRDAARRYGKCVAEGVYYRSRSCTCHLCLSCIQEGYEGGTKPTFLPVDVALRTAALYLKLWGKRSNHTFGQLRAIQFHLSCPGCDPPDYGPL